MRIGSCCFLAAAVLVARAEGAEPVAPIELKTAEAKTSYAIGVQTGQLIKDQGVQVDPAIVARGIADALSGGKKLLSDEEIEGLITDLNQEISNRQTNKRKNVAETNKQEGPKFLAENKKKPGVKTTKSGLQYKVITEGTGDVPKLTDEVTTHYRGTLINGTEFDSSHKRGEPSTFPVGGVIRGWTEALQMMKVGSKWQLFIPAELAYGDRGAGADIGPHATLIFEIELLGIGSDRSTK